MQWLDGSLTRHSAGSMSFSFCTTLLDCRSGRLLDASSTFFRTTGFTPGGALQKLLDHFALPSSPDDAPPVAITDADFPLIRAKREPADADLGAVRWTPLWPAKQYPSTLQLLQQFLLGELRTLRAPVGCRWADGCAYEFEANFWAVESEVVVEKDGRRWRRPLRMSVAGALDHYCLVDEAE